MSQIDGGGSAFPHGEIVEPIYDDAGNVTGHRVYNSRPGMRLRDWFAGQALQGNLAYPGVDLSPESAAIMAYRYADAMLAQRRLTKPE